MKMREREREEEREKVQFRKRDEVVVHGISQVWSSISADGTQGARGIRNLLCAVQYVWRRRPLPEEQKHMAEMQHVKLHLHQRRSASQTLCVLMSTWDYREGELDDWSTMS